MLKISRSTENHSTFFTTFKTYYIFYILYKEYFNNTWKCGLIVIVSSAVSFRRYSSFAEHYICRFKMSYLSFTVVLLLKRLFCVMQLKFRIKKKKLFVHITFYYSLKRLSWSDIFVILFDTFTCFKT